MKALRFSSKNSCVDGTYFLILVGKKPQHVGLLKPISGHSKFYNTKLFVLLRIELHLIDKAVVLSFLKLQNLLHFKTQRP